MMCAPSLTRPLNALNRSHGDLWHENAGCWPGGHIRDSARRRGITKDVMRIGAVVNVEGARARDGSNHSSTRRLTFEDGTAVLAPPAEE